MQVVSHDIKDFFHSKIDWKLFRYLQDILLQYEDRGYEAFLDVKIYNREYEDTNWNLYSTIFAYSTNSEQPNGYVNTRMTQEAKDKYKLDGLFYVISFMEWIEDNNKDIIERISLQCLIIDNSNKSHYIIVKPK